VDLSEESIALARRRAELGNLGHLVAFVTADAERLSSAVSPEPYDLVYSFGVIHHTPYPERVIAEIREHFVHAGTVLRLMLYHRLSWKVLSILMREGRGAFWRLDELVSRSSEAQTGCPVTYTYSLREARRLLRGFDVIDAHVDFIFPYRVGDYVEYRYVRPWYFERMPPSMFRLLERHLGWHLCLTAKPASA
jgi:SAM-dependent methyltransferase